MTARPDADRAYRSFLQRVKDRPDGEHATDAPDDPPWAEVVGAIHGSTLAGLSDEEREDLFFHAHRLFGGMSWIPQPKLLRVADMGALVRGRRRAFERRGRSVEWIQQQIAASRYATLFVFGTTDDRALATSSPTYEAPSARDLLARLRAVPLLGADVAARRWKMWIPVAKSADTVARARLVLAAATRDVEAQCAESEVSIVDLAWLGNAGAILMAAADADSVATLVALAHAAPSVRSILVAHAFELHHVTALAPLHAALAEHGHGP